MSSHLLRLAVSCNFSDLVINRELFGSSVWNMFGKLPGKIPTNITVHIFAKYRINFGLFAKLVNYCCYFLILFKTLIGNYRRLLEQQKLSLARGINK